MMDPKWIKQQLSFAKGVPMELVDDGFYDSCSRFYNLLKQWNSVYNLTGVIEPKELINRHIIDSLMLLPHLSGARVLDVGSGAGFPGIPLALAQPSRLFGLLDSSFKAKLFFNAGQGTVEFVAGIGDSFSC